jgi:hypothetical protein
MEEMEIDLIVMSSRLPIGVATRYRPPCNSPCKIKGSGNKLTPEQFDQQHKKSINYNHIFY